MRRLWAAMVLGLSLVTAPARAAEPIQVMVLGTFHFANPGEDKVNSKIDPVTTPGKQAELAELADRLARFRPTLIAVERVAPDQSALLDDRYPSFKPEDLLKNPDERVQIGYRLARQSGLPRVYAIDEMAGPGEPDYFPFEPVQAWAQAHGRMAEIEALFGPAQAAAAQLESEQKTRPLYDLLADVNAPDHPVFIKGQGAGYYQLLAMGAGRDLPGADLNARWYARNARIFAKLTQVARPGDRVLIVYGAGHNYWLRHFASETAGFRLVEAGPFLTKTAPAP